jgi:hypothetical protein
MLARICETYFPQQEQLDANSAAAMTSGLVRFTTQLLCEDTTHATLILLKGKKGCNASLLEVLSYAMSYTIQSFVQGSSSDSDSSEQLERVQHWQQLLTQAGEEWQPIELRLAAARSLRITQIMSLCLAKAEANQQDDCWSMERSEVLGNLLLLLLSLLQDDDEDVRYAANTVCCSMLRYVYSSMLMGEHSVLAKAYRCSHMLTAIPATLEHMGVAIQAMLFARPSIDQVQVLLWKLWQRFQDILGSVESVQALLVVEAIQPSQQLSQKVFSIQLM